MGGPSGRSTPGSSSSNSLVLLGSTRQCASSCTANAIPFSSMASCSGATPTGAKRAEMGSP
eukprot:4147999-Pyramimonas_sp.AAC.1